MEKIFLQFGEAANSSLVHLWNYLATSDACVRENDTEGDELNRTATYEKLHGFGYKPRTLIYSERISLKSVIALDTLSSKSHHPIPESGKAVINQKTGRWTDFNYATEFSEASYHECPQFDPTRTFLASFYDSKSKASFTEEFEDNTRRLAESCDWLEGFNFVTEGVGSIASCTLHALEFLNDEYVKAPKIVASFSERIKVLGTESINWENCDKFDGDEVGAAIKMALTYTAISDQNVTFIPLAPFSKCPPSPLKPFEKIYLSHPPDCTRFFSGVFYDLFGQQSVPGRSQFASLMGSCPSASWNFTNANFSAIEKNSSTNTWRKVPLVLDTIFDYEFSQVDLVTHVDFNSKPFASAAAGSLAAINRPRLVWQQLEAVGVSDELAAGDYYQEICETLHQIKDLAVLYD